MMDCIHVVVRFSEKNMLQYAFYWNQISHYRIWSVAVVLQQHRHHHKLITYNKYLLHFLLTLNNVYLCGVKGQHLKWEKFS